jgi:hypothetical protein
MGDSTADSWPFDGLPDALLQTASSLTARGLPAEYYVVPEGDYYRPVIGGSGAVHCLDVQLGPAVRQRGRSTHCAVHVFDPRRPNLGLYLCYDRVDRTGRPVDDNRLPRVSTALDRSITYTLMPVVNTMLSPFDPTGGNRSVVVGCWHGRPTLDDLVYIPITASKLLRDFSGEGQLALIWADFQAPLATAASRLARLLARSRRAHFLARTRCPSHIRFPIRDDSGEYICLSNLSDATDTGVRLAQGYLDEKMNRYTGTHPSH